MKVLPYLNLVLLLALAAGPAMAQSHGSTPREALKNAYLGRCQNPERAFTSSPTQAQMERLARWCACMNSAIDNIPDDKLSQVTGASFNDATGRKGYSQGGEFSLIRISEACAGR